MGIPELWKLLGDGEIMPLAKLASDHFQRVGRPLRIAIDEAGWRFNNLSEAQVDRIRQTSNEPAYNGIEKNIFYRLAKLLRWNIQPLFVFDGPHRPWKRGKVAGRVDYNQIKLLTQLLDRLRIPHHRAPAEAEAECARLQQEGVVDAVWSEDADALMFGCGMLIRDYRVAKKGFSRNAVAKEATTKSCTHVRVYRQERIRELHGLDREGLVLFAVLCGGDYDTTGLKGCGPSAALRAIKRGLGKSLCACVNNADLVRWRAQLEALFGKRFDIPLDFPKEKVVKNYSQPRVSSSSELRSLRGLENGWDVPLDEEAIRVFVSERFNIGTKRYMDWIGPILLAKHLAQESAGQIKNDHDVKLVRQRKKDNANLDDDAEVKISFSPFALSSLDLQTLLNGHWDGGANDSPVDWSYRVSSELVDCVLRRGLPEDVFVAPAPAPKGQRKRKKVTQQNEEEQESGCGPTPKRKRTTTVSRTSPAADSTQLPATIPPAPQEPLFRFPAVVDHLLDLPMARRTAAPIPTDHADVDDDAEPFHEPQSITDFSASEENHDLREAIRRSLQDCDPNRSRSPKPGPGRSEPLTSRRHSVRDNVLEMLDSDISIVRPRATPRSPKQDIKMGRPHTDTSAAPPVRSPVVPASIPAPSTPTSMYAPGKTRVAPAEPHVSLQAMEGSATLENEHLRAARLAHFVGEKTRTNEEPREVPRLSGRPVEIVDLTSD